MNADSINCLGASSTFTSCNLYCYCRNNYVGFVDIYGYAEQNCIGKANSENVRLFFGLDANSDLPSLENDCMLFIENVNSFSIPGTNVAIIKGQPIIFNYDQYCEYDYWGISYGKGTFVYEYSETKGFVYGVKNVEDYNGIFFGNTNNLVGTASGGAVATNGVKATIVSGQSTSSSSSFSITSYKSRYSTWQKGTAPISWHSGLYWQIPGSGRLIEQNV